MKSFNNRSIKPQKGTHKIGIKIKKKINKKEIPMQIKNKNKITMKS